MQARYLALINAALTVLAKLQPTNDQVQAQLVDYSFGAAPILLHAGKQPATSS
jgi:hypothetical protein